VTCQFSAKRCAVIERSGKSQPLVPVGSRAIPSPQKASPDVEWTGSSSCCHLVINGIRSSALRQRPKCNLLHVEPGTFGVPLSQQESPSCL